MLLIVHNAPGRSAFNCVERALSFLNGAISGVVLDLFTHGEHVKNGEVPDELKELEKQNIDAALEMLKELWKNVAVNGCQMATRAILTGTDEHSSFVKSILQYKTQPSSLTTSDRLQVERFLLFMYKHSSFSQYLGQIRRCDDTDCCKSIDAQIANILKNHHTWFPTAVPKSSKEWYSFTELLSQQFVIPDTHCPSVQKDKLNEGRNCAECNLVYTSKERFVQHRKFLHNFSFVTSLAKDKVITTFADHTAIDLEIEKEIQEEVQEIIEKRNEMGFETEGSIHQQFAALTLAGAKNTTTPCLPCKTRSRASSLSEYQFY